MAKRGGTVWHFYPSDAPGPIDFDSPANAPFWVKKFVWRNQTDFPITNGATIHITDADENDVFRRVWPDDVDHTTNEICFEPCTYYRSMKFEVFEQGVLDVVLE